MLVLPEETSIALVQNKKEIENVVVPDILAGLNRTTREGFKVANYNIRYYIDKNTDIPSFDIDYMIKADDDNILLVDMRAFVNKEGEPTKLALRDYNYRKHRAVLTAMWASGNQQFFLSNLLLAGKVFTSVMTNRLSSFYGMDAKEQLITQAVLATYYGHLHRDGKVDATKAERDIRSYTTVPATPDIQSLVIDALVETVSDTYSINALIDVLKTALYSPKFKSITAVRLLTHIKGIIYFFKSEVDIAAAMEYPPIWIAMLHLASTDKSVRRSIITSSLIKLTHNDLSVFSRLVEHQTRGYL